MIVAGFGFRAAATLADLQDALALTGEGRVDRIATADDKVASAAFRDLAAALGVPVVAVPPDDLARRDVATRSRASLKTRRTGSVAEASALCAAGKAGRLLAPRVKTASGMATCALAEGEAP